MRNSNENAALRAVEAALELLRSDSTIEGTTKESVDVLLDIAVTKLRASGEYLCPEISSIANGLIPLIRDNDDLMSIFDMIAGAILCLIEAKKLGFRDRPGPLPPTYKASVLKYVEAMKNGNFSPHKLWLAGWSFNSALVRIAAAYHRTLRAISNRKKGNREELLRRLPTFVDHDSLDKVYEQVNELKHSPMAGDFGRSVSMDESICALKELLTFISISRPTT